MSKAIKLTFAGTGGGGGMVATQQLSTGGTYLESSRLKLYIDPGPGALLRALQLKVPVKELDGILLTHKHIDHCHDLPVMIEAWINLDSPEKSPGIKNIYAPKDYWQENPLKSFLASKVRQAITVKPQTDYVIKDSSIRTSKALIEKPFYSNDLPQVYGYWVKGARIDIGFWSQSQYRPRLTEGFRPKILVMDFWNIEPKILDQQVKIIQEIGPQVIILRHFTLSMYNYGLEKVRSVVSQRTGVKTIIAPEGDSFEI